MFASEGESQKQFFVLFLVGEWARVGGGELLGIEKCIAKMRFWKCCTLRGVETQSVFFFLILNSGNAQERAMVLSSGP